MVQLKGISLKRIYRHLERIKVRDTYKSLDVGVIAGLTFFANKPANIYVRYIHGLRKLLEYPQFDKFGNTTGEIKAVKNVAFQVGFRLNITD